MNLRNKECILVFTDNNSGDKIGIYYHSWLFVIKCILIKYANKTSDEADEIFKQNYYDKWYDNCLKENNLNMPFECF